MAWELLGITASFRLTSFQCSQSSASPPPFPGLLPATQPCVGSLECYTHPDVPKQMAAVSNQRDGEVGCYSLILLLFQHVCTCAIIRGDSWHPWCLAQSTHLHFCFSFSFHISLRWDVAQDVLELPV